MINATPLATYLRGQTRYPLRRRLGGPQGRSGRFRKISLLPGIDHRIVQSVASRYIDCAMWRNSRLEKCCIICFFGTFASVQILSYREPPTDETCHDRYGAQHRQNKYLKPNIRIVEYNFSSVCSTYVYPAVIFYGFWLIQPRLLPPSFPTLIFLVFLIRVGHILVIFVILWPRVPCFASRMFASRATPTFGQVQNRAVPIRRTWQQSWQCASISPPKNYI